MHASMADAVALIAARYGAIATLTAGGTGDATEINGAYVDRLGFASVKVVVAYTATLAGGATLTIAANLQDATDDAGAAVADYGDAYAATVVATGPSGGGTVTGVVELDFPLYAAKRFIRAQATPDLSAANIDTARVAITYVLAGPTDGPATATAV